MPFKALPFFLLFFLISCAPTKKPVPFIPPGQQIGQTWESAEEFGYSEPIYTIPEYIAYPLKGNRALLSALQNTVQINSCKNMDQRVFLRFVVSPEGEILGAYPVGTISSECKSRLESTLKQFDYFPAEHNGQNVHMLLTLTVVNRT